MQPKAPSFIADFDSSSAMLRASANILHGRDFPTLGKTPSFLLSSFALSVSHMPWALRKQVYALGGALEGWPAEKLAQVDAGEMTRWATESYPSRTYPAVMIGSSNGALVHLAAAFGIPWLPQTALFPVRHLNGDPDQPKQALAFGQRYGPQLLQANPDLQLHHMHDANQDRLMVRHMEYFRVKRLTLGEHYEAFLESCLEPGGTIVIVNCERRWPTTRVGERHVFQHGALGGATAAEFHHGSERIHDFLERYQAPVRQWDSPEPDGDSPEAEWGFEPALRDDILRFAKRHGLRVQQLTFQEPDDLSPLVADFYREWYRERGIPADRLLVESFILMEPYWALRTGSVPFWMKFNMAPSADSLERYLDARPQFDEINLMLFNHGIEGAGFAPIERWRELLERARLQGSFIGLKEELFPRDFGALARYHSHLKKLKPNYPLPEPLPFPALEQFLKRSEYDYSMRLETLA